MHSMADLQAKTGYSPRAIRMFIDRGLVARPKHGGRKTMYDDDFLLRVLAIRTLRRAQIPIGAIKSQIRSASDAELRTLAGLPPIGVTPPAPPAAPSRQSTQPPAAHASLQTIGERWTRIAIAPGLDLLLREGATPEVTRLALEIRAKTITPT